MLLFDHGHGQVSTTPVVDTPVTLARGALVVQSALAILVGVTLSRHRILRQRAIDFRRVSPGAMLASLGLVLGLAPIANDLGFRLSEALRAAPDNARWVTTIIHQASRGQFLMLAFSLTILPACVEELLFRGLLMGALLGARRGLVIVLQALLFGAFHVDLAQGIATFVLGLGFGFMRMSTRSLVAPMVAHAAYNVIVLLTMRWMNIANETSTHQGLGVMATGLLLSAVCVVVLDRHFNRRFGEPGTD
jgi:membrane protease YdiL (CAAX protease family)